MLSIDAPRPARQRRAPHPSLTVRAVSKRLFIEVWLFEGEQPVRRWASVNKALAADAGRHGQKLLEDAADDALRSLECGTSRGRHRLLPRKRFIRFTSR